MSIFAHEFRLFSRSRLAVVSILLLGLLAAASIIAGMAEIERQRAVIAALGPQQEADIAAVAKAVDKTKDAGSAAYYSFHLTWHAPSDLAFAAIGLRDVAPYTLRVRALGLEAQLYDGEIYNPELALPGRFDFAFVLVYLAPLFVIALFHDLISGEREAGRLTMLRALPGARWQPWLQRGALRFGLLFAALALPFLIGAAISGATPGAIIAVLGLTAAYLAFWVAVCAIVARLGGSSVTNAATLAAAWLVLTLVLPALAHVAINRIVPVSQGVELTLAQRDAVHQAWDIPKQVTMDRFYVSHPEWKNSPPLTEKFHWKWYYAFHQVGDEQVAEQAAAYRRGLLARDQWTRRAGWLLPSVGVQVAMTRLAQTDLPSHLAYQDRIRAFHAALRHFYYAYLFTDQPFGLEDFGKAPRFSETAPTAVSWPEK